MIMEKPQPTPDQKDRTNFLNAAAAEELEGVMPLKRGLEVDLFLDQIPMVPSAKRHKAGNGDDQKGSNTAIEIDDSDMIKDLMGLGEHLGKSIGSLQSPASLQSPTGIVNGFSAPNPEQDVFVSEEAANGELNGNLNMVAELGLDALVEAHDRSERNGISSEVPDQTLGVEDVEEAEEQEEEGDEEEADEGENGEFSQDPAGEYDEDREEGENEDEEEEAFDEDPEELQDADEDEDENEELEGDENGMDYALGAANAEQQEDPEDEDEDEDIEERGDGDPEDEEEVYEQDPPGAADDEKDQPGAADDDDDEDVDDGPEDAGAAGGVLGQGRLEPDDDEDDEDEDEDLEEEGLGDEVKGEEVRGGEVQDENPSENHKGPPDEGNGI